MDEGTNNFRGMSLGIEFKRDGPRYKTFKGMGLSTKYKIDGPGYINFKGRGSRYKSSSLKIQYKNQMLTGECFEKNKTGQTTYALDFCIS